MVIDYIDKNRHISKRLYRSDCININKSWFKDVSRFVNNEDHQNIIVIDDIPYCHLTLRSKFSINFKNNIHLLK
jgi:TFIIF-interacting CTD phosphatase-like protein